MCSPGYKWLANGDEHELRLVAVAGTAGQPYLFGAEPHRRPIEVPVRRSLQCLWRSAGR